MSSGMAAPLSFGVGALQGQREYMEDRTVTIPDVKQEFSLTDAEGHSISLFGVYDGHGGARCANHLEATLATRVVGELSHGQSAQRLVQSLQHGELSEKLVRKAFLASDKEFCENSLQTLQPNASTGRIMSSGSTACIVFILGDDNGYTCVCANVGDSRAMLYDGQKAIRLNRDHDPSTEADEVRRVEQAGGYIVQRSIPRVNGHLAMTRAFGDVSDKVVNKSQPVEGAQPVIAQPELRSARAPTDRSDVASDNLNPKFLVVASDGLWGSLNEAEVASFVTQELARDTNRDAGTAKRIADALCEEAVYARGSSDNTSAVVVLLE